MTSVASRKSCCIRPAMHPGLHPNTHKTPGGDPGLRRCSSVKYTEFSLLAPCGPGASRASVLAGLPGHNTSERTN
jgi:hypothetical protein